MRDGRMAWAAVILATSCTLPPAPPDGGASVGTGDGVSAAVLLGTFERGYGTPGLSMLALLEDEEGASWTGEVLDDRDEVVTSFTYGTPDGVHAAGTWWPTVPASYGGRYTVRFLESGGRELKVKATLAATSGLAVPALELSSDKLRLDWPVVAGAVTYECVSSQGSAAERVASPGCDLIQGQTTVTVRALSVDLSVPIRASELPRSFDVSEASYSYAVGGSGSRVRAALGSIQYTAGATGFAALVSVQTSTGTAPSTDFEVEIVGPAFGAGGSLKGTHRAGTDRLILWSYDVEPVDGPYEIRVRSGAESLAFTLRAAPVSSLPEVSGLTVAPRGIGGAAATWQPVAGARGYYVSAWASSTGELIASSWVTDPNYVFPPGTLPSGERCDVYVASSSADPSTGGLLPSTISLSENTYRPVAFVPM